MTVMHAFARPYRYARLIAWFTWLVVGGQELVQRSSAGAVPGGGQLGLWLAAFLCFGPVLLEPPQGSRLGASPAFRYGRLALLTLAPMVMTYADPYSYGCTLLVIVAWELAIALPLRVVVPWVLAQSAVTTMLLDYGLPLKTAVLVIALHVGFQGYAVITAFLAQSEAAARAGLAGVHADLKATQSMLTHGARMTERLRIARELHDLLGHHLSALVVNLEIARHKGGAAEPHVVKAQAQARQLLGDVRSSVRLLRGDDRAELRSLLEQVAGDVPEIDIHLNVADDADAEDPERTQAVVRLVQETLTNALRHSGCRNLWIDLTRRGDSLELHIRDDGHGAPWLVWGNGLRGMRERLEELGGGLTVVPVANPGFSLTAVLPQARSEA